MCSCKLIPVFVVIVHSITGAVVPDYVTTEPSGFVQPFFDLSTQPTKQELPFHGPPNDYKPKPCEEPKTVKNGRLLFVDSLTRTLQCRERYIVEGNAFIRCVGGKWTEPGRCAPDHMESVRECGTLPAVENGSFNVTRSTRQRQLVCHDGFAVLGAQAVRCAHGIWSSPGICQDLSCKVPSIDNGTTYVREKTGGITQLRAGSKIQQEESLLVLCNEGFELSDEKEIICSTKSQFNRNVPRCVPQDAQTGHLIKGTPTTAPMPIELPPAPGSSNGYVVKHYLQCWGGVAIGELAKFLSDCKSYCNSDPSCKGINYVHSSGECIAKSSDCRLNSTIRMSFYEKQPQDPTRPPTSSATTTSTLAVTRPSIKLENYFPRQGMRCVNGSGIEGVSQYLGGCEAHCNSDPLCKGINYVISMGLCITRSSDCQLTSNNAVIFYEKQPQTPTRPPPIANTSTTSITDTVQLDNYVRRPGMRCANGSGIGRLSEDLSECKAYCNSNASCKGINYVSPLGLCIARSQDCRLKSSNAVIFYEKKAQTTPRQPPIVTEDPGHASSQPYIIIIGMQCKGGHITGHGLDSLGQCKAKCNASPSCRGVNYIASTRKCAVRSLGCELVSDNAFSFHQKVPLPQAFPAYLQPWS